MESPAGAKKQRTKFCVGSSLLQKQLTERTEKFIKDISERFEKSVQSLLTDLFRALTHDDTAPLVILQGAVGMAHHLKHIIDGVVHIAGAEERNRKHVRRPACLQPQGQKMKAGR